MSQRVLDKMDSAAGWSVLAPDGATASDQLALAVTAQQTRTGIAAGRLELTASAASDRHMMRRDLAATVDLSDVDELRFWIRATVPADGSSERPFYLQLRLAGGGVAFDAAENTWARYLPVFRPNTWEWIRVSLADLPAAIRKAVAGMRFQCLRPLAAFRCAFDVILGVREQLMTDVQEALRARLDAAVKFNGTPAPAVVHSPDAAAPTPAHIGIVPAQMEFASEVSGQNESRTDFTDGGFLLRPPGPAYNVYFDIDGYAADAAQRAVLLDAVLDRLAPFSYLTVNGEEFPVELAPPIIPLAALAARIPLRFKVQAWRSTSAAGPAVKPVRSLVVDGGAI